MATQTNMKDLSFNQFQTLVREAWKTEGQGAHLVKMVHYILIYTPKNPDMTKKDVICAAWKYYKEVVF